MILKCTRISKDGGHKQVMVVDADYIEDAQDKELTFKSVVYLKNGTKVYVEETVEQLIDTARG